MNEFQQQILEKIDQIALKLQNYKSHNVELIKLKEELVAKVEYLEKREHELNSLLENQKADLEDKSHLFDKATNKIEELLGSIEIDG